jgi:VanZ family protein
MSAILIAISALLSEVSQIFIVSRTLSLKDLGFNLLGLGLGAIISKWIDGKKRTKYST